MRKEQRTERVDLDPRLKDDTVRDQSLPGIALKETSGLTQSKPADPGLELKDAQVQ